MARESGNPEGERPDEPGRERPEEPDSESQGRRPRTAAPGEAVSGFPETPGKDPGDRSRDPTPHHALSNPVEAPDETEWPDPYDKREDPLAPAGPDTFGEEPHPPPGASSTSRPHPSQDPEGEPWEGPKRDKVDE